MCFNCETVKSVSPREQPFDQRLPGRLHFSVKSINNNNNNDDDDAFKATYINIAVFFVKPKAIAKSMEGNNQNPHKPYQTNRNKKLQHQSNEKQTTTKNFKQNTPANKRAIKQASKQ